jgi:NADPH:quinone reductase-like Zn-dependent oxidoreductase
LHAGRLTPWVDRVFDFDKLPQAREYMQSNQHIGKVIIRV